MNYEMNKTRLDWIRWGAVLLLLAVGWINYKYTFSYTMIFIRAPIEDMSHAYVVPLVSLLAIVLRRNEFRRLAGQPSWRGFGWLVLFLAIAWFGARGGQERIKQVSLIGLIWAIPYALWGPGVGRLMLFPAGFLLFTVPVSSYLDLFTVHLRMLSSNFATGILNGFGMAVERSGTAVFSRAPGHEFNVDVADPCSGIRSLFAMMALTAAYAHFMMKTKLQKWMLFSTSIPIAMVGNMFRIFSICLVALIFGQDAATGFYHDYSGFVIFFIGLSLMLQTVRLIMWLDAWLQRQKFLPGWLFEPDATEHMPFLQPTAKRVLLCTGLVCGLTILVFQSHRFFGDLTHDAISLIADDLPHQIAGFTSDRPWFCHNEQCYISEEEAVLIKKELRDGDGFTCPSCGGPMRKISLGEQNDLPKDTEILKRVYRSPDGRTYSVSIVISDRNRGSIHRPELCLPAQGFIMQKTGTYPLHVPGGKPQQVRMILAQRSSSDQQFSLAYWFVSRERECSSHAERILIDMWDRSVRNRINRWAMIGVNISPPLDSKERFKDFEVFLGELYPQLLRAQ